MNQRNDRKRPFWRYLVFAFLLIAIIGIGTSASMFSSWSQLESMSLKEATISMDAAIERLEDQRTFITISETGEVNVHRELQARYRDELAALNVIAYDPGSERLLRVRFPFWFVKVKTNNKLNLGTLVSLFSKDWDNLDLDVTEDDLMRRGPGLVLDHARSNGGRIIIWSE